MADAARNTRVDWLGVVLYGIALLFVVVGIIAAAVRCGERGGVLVAAVNWSVSECVPRLAP